MAEVNLTSEELTILGGPSEILVNLDIGPEGDRGSYILVGYGNPNLPGTSIGEIPQVYDMYINILTSDPEYLYIYQYLNVGGTTSWVRLMKLTPNTFSYNTNATFVDGATTINVPINAIVPSYPEILANVTSENFNIQYNVLGSMPASTSCSVGSIIVDGGTGLQVLPITISGMEYSEEAWTSFSGSKTVHLYITVV